MPPGPEKSMSRFSFTTKYGKKWLIVIFILAIGGAYYLFTRQRKVDFNAEIKPIFNKNCIICHGGVRHQANFSLLFRSDALAVNKSGKRAIIPGDPEHSEMIRRLTLKDPEDRMPFKHPPLAPGDISLLRKWIKEGAQWGDHWAYVAVQPVVVPIPYWALRSLIYYWYSFLKVKM